MIKSNLFNLKNFSNILSKLYNSNFIRVSSISSLLTILQTAISVVMTKIISVKIGAEGVAMLGQLRNFMQIGTLFSSGGFIQGITKYIAEKNNNFFRLKFIGTAFAITLILTFFTSVTFIFYSKNISIFIFNKNQYNSIIVIFGSLLIFTNINNLLLSVVNGLQKYSLFYKINLINVLVGFLFMLFFVLFYGLYGALLAVVITQTFVFILTFFLVKKMKIRMLGLIKFYNNKHVTLLLKYSVITFGAAILWPIVNLVIRSYLIKNFTAQNAGIWQATRNINDYITTITMGGFSIYLLPHLATIKDKNLLKIELLKIYKIIIPLSLFGFFSIYFTRDLIINLLYTKEFLPVRDYLLLQMIGTFFWLCKVPIMNCLLAQGQTKLYFYNELFFALFYMGLCIILIPIYKIQGIQFAFAIYNFIYLIIYIIIMKRYLNK
jgi:O-antigen/teichoic acid export membrane protein